MMTEAVQHHGIHHVVDLLKYISDKQRYRETQNKTEGASLGHIRSRLSSFSKNGIALHLHSSMIFFIIATWRRVCSMQPYPPSSSNSVTMKPSKSVRAMTGMISS